MRYLVAAISPALALPKSLALLAADSGRSLLSPRSSPRTLGTCVACARPVHADQPFLRYRGAYYHGSVCVERHPPAARRRAHLTGGSR